MRELSELRFRVVRGVGRGIAVLNGVHVIRVEGEVFTVLFPDFYYWEYPCAAVSPLLGQLLEMRGAWASASRAG